MAWTNYQQRPEPLRQMLASRLAATAPVKQPETYYNENDLGLLSDADLGEWIAKLDETSSVKQLDAPAAPTYSASDAYQIRSLRWLMNNAETVADKELARKQYLETLFGLWRKHVALTGETYYKGLREEIWERYQAMQHELN